MPNNIRIGAQVTGARKAASELDTLRDKFTRLQKTSAKGFITGVGAGIGIGVLNEVGRAIGKVGEIVGEATDAFIDDERSQRQLGASLRANVAGWDGNTAAIEKTLRARMKLGFSDEDQRDALSRLVAATHNVDEALAIEATAMDLARFKGISLGEATDALTKVEAGSYRILKSLGIVLKDGATQTEALAAVQAVASGQAETFAKTTEGKLVVSQLRSAEAIEKHGKATADLSVAWNEFWANSLDPAGASLEDFANSPGWTDLTNAAREAGITADRAWELFQNGADLTGEALRAAALEEDRAAASASHLAAETKLAAEDNIELVAHLPDRNDFGGMAKGFWDVRQQARQLNDVIGETTSAIGDLFDEAERPGAMQEISDRIHDLKKEIRDTNDKGDLRILQGDLIDLYQQGFELASKDGPQAGIDFLLQWRDATSKTDKKTLDLIDHLLVLARRMKALSGPFAATITGAGGPGGHRAAGGPVSANTPYVVGEQGPEIMVPSGSGTVIPNNQIGMGGVTVNVNVAAPRGGDAKVWGTAVGDAVAAALRQQTARLPVGTRA